MGAIEDFFKEFFVSLLQDLLNNAAEFLNLGFTDGLQSLYQTPAEAVGSDVISTVTAVTQASIVPVGYVILAYVLCYELITTIINGNNFKDFDTAIFFKFAIKGGIGITLMGKASDIAFAFFDLGSEMTVKSQQTISLNAVSLYTMTFDDELLEKKLGFLVGLVILALLLYIVMIAIYIVIFVVLIGRVMEIMVYCALAPIPIATLTNREWGGMGNNYLKNLGALAFQTILIMVVLGIFTGLMQGVMTAVSTVDELPKSMLKALAYGVVLCFTMLKTGNISKSIFGAH